MFTRRRLPETAVSATVGAATCAVLFVWLPIFRGAVRNNRASIGDLVHASDGGRVLWSGAVVVAMLAVTAGFVAATAAARTARPRESRASGRVLARLTTVLASITVLGLVTVALVPSLRVRGTSSLCLSWYAGPPQCTRAQVAFVPTAWFGLMIVLALGASAWAIHAANSTLIARITRGVKHPIASWAGAMLVVAAVAAPSYEHSTFGGRWWGGWHSVLLLTAATASVAAALATALGHRRASVSVAVAAMGLSLAAGLAVPTTGVGARRVSWFGEPIWVAGLRPSWGYYGAVVGSVAVLWAALSTTRALSIPSASPAERS